MASRAAQYFASKKLRLYLAWPATLLALWIGRPTTTSIVNSLPFVVVGAVMRWWAAGCVRKGRALATGGIYAHLRHPLYVGSFVILLGCCLMLQQPLLWLVLPTGFAVFYWRTLRQEEAALAQKFGDAYRHYARAVPRFLPRLTPYRASTTNAFSWRQAYANGESITALAVGLAVLGIYAWARARAASDDGLSLTWWIVAAAVAAELALQVLERRRKDRPAHPSVGTQLHHYRAWLPVPLVVGGVLVLLIIGNPWPRGSSMRATVDLAGLACLVLAEAIRMWGVGHCGRKTRSASIHASLLVMSGPYAYVRHPLYISNLLLTVGIACLTGWWWTVLACVLYWIVVYRRIISAEEAFLRATFGPAFEAYCRTVPPLVPRLRPPPLPPSSTFRRAELRKEYQTVIAIVASVLCVEAALAAQQWLPKASRVWLHRLSVSTR